MNAEKKALRIRFTTAQKDEIRNRWFCENEIVVCHWCGKKLHDSKRSMNDGSFVTIDHLVEQAFGGTDRFDNLVPACAKCNNTRSSAKATEIEKIKGPSKAFEPLADKYVVDLKKPVEY